MLLSLLASCLATVALAACGSSGSEGESSAAAPAEPGAVEATPAKGGEAQFTIGWVPPTIAPFEKVLREGIKLQAEKQGMSLVVAGGEFNPAAQISAVDALVQREVDALLVWPIDEKGIQPALDRARAQHIPIITIDSPNANANVNFQTNDFEAAKETAEAAAAQIGAGCKVGIIEGLPIVATLKARNEGYAKGAEASGCEILDRQVNTEDTPEKAGEIAAAWKTRFGGEMTGILAINDPSALAAAALVGGEFKPLIFGANGDPTAIEAIEDGQMAGTQSAPSPEIGNGLAAAAHDLLTGEKVAKTIDVSYDVVTAKNVGEYVSYEERLQGPMVVTFEGSGNSANLVTQLAGK
ncbi:MAG: sugar ABC transporter substrate-binding protein [Actinobacteria bacterium]|nr:sugar ABC transporter substrate-binding protein [Actinomycetota bacterium]